jgi:uncharacterized protein YjbI with pentapeptide repeats
LTLLELLTAGRIDEFNARRGQRVTLDFFAADFAGLDLRGANLTGANLEKADLTGADLTDAVLARADLTGADLTGACLERCVAIKARLREAYLGDARAASVEMSGADLAGADLSGLKAEGGRFAGARLKGAVLTNAVLTGADLTEARLGDADLRGADLTNAKLGEADLERVNASGARLTGADLKSARMAGAVLRSAVLVGADLTGADLSAADLSGADLTGTLLEGADLFDTVADPGVLPSDERAAVVAAPDDAVELHFENPSVATSGAATAVLWENADADDAFVLRYVVTKGGAPVRSGSRAFDVPADEVLAHAVLPTAAGFQCALVLDRGAGVELMVVPLGVDGALGTPRTVRLGYTPSVKPIFVPDGDAVLVHGIGKEGVLATHRFDGTTLHELMRAPAGGYRGFCGRLDPVLLGKEGTVGSVRRNGISRLLPAPVGYPGRLTAAAHQQDAGRIALAWAGKADLGVRFVTLAPGGEQVRVDAQAAVGAVDLAAFGDRWLLVYTRESQKDEDVTAPMGVWLPDGKPFPLLAGEDVVDVSEVSILPGPTPQVALVTFGEDLLVVEVGAAGGVVRARFGELSDA